MIDFLKHIAKRTQNLSPEEVQVKLVHSGSRILEREMPEKLSLHAQKVLRRRGMDLMLDARLRTATPDAAIVMDKDTKKEIRIPTKTLVSTVPSSPNPIVDALDLPKERGKIHDRSVL